MAKKSEHANPEQNPETTNPEPAPALAPAPAPVTPVATVATVADERFVMVTTDGRHGTTANAQVKRIDLIRGLWQTQKMPRGQIAKYLSEISGKKIPYQIVFSGTKGLPGGPDKVAAPVAPVA
jgi:hypothetical protein